MKIISDSSAILHNEINKAQDIEHKDLSFKDISARDVVIINPYCEGGGDEALAKKIANIALDEGCRVTIYSFNTSIFNGGDENIKHQNYALQHEEPHDISQLNNPLFIIAPVGIASVDILEKHIESICEKFSFSRNDAVIIEEMDILTIPGKELTHYAAMLKEKGFTHVSVNSLGFGDGAIGYIPTDEKIISQIQNRFENQLTKLLDSYNISLSSENSYHLGYISSNCCHSGSQVFITNTLSETIEDDRNAIFIMSIRQLNDISAPLIADGIADILQAKDDEFNIPSLFSKATVTVINSESGDVENSKEVIGYGKKKVNIILTNKLPKNIYDNFLLLADTGMSSGDQSLSEYLSVKGTLPYYDLQPWKQPLMSAIKKSADVELQRYLDTKFIGQLPFTGEKIYSLIPDIQRGALSPELLIKKNEFDKNLASKIATPHIKAIIRSNMK